MVQETLTDAAQQTWMRQPLARISGMAPKCRIVSLKVVRGDGRGMGSRVIQALDAIDEINEHGRNIRIHGVDAGLVYGWDSKNYACGQSPFCVAVDRLVSSGVGGFDSEDGAVRYGKLLTFMAHLVGLFVGSGLFTVMSGGDDNILHV